MTPPDPDWLDRRAADTAARHRAQREFARPLLLEAGAGTGKTSVLVTRVLAWTLGPGWERAEAALASGPDGGQPEAIAGRVLERVVAVTFTEAAAAEMEERIARGLDAIVAGGDAWPTGLDRDAVPPDPEQRRARGRALLGAFDRLRVSTIHAFCRRLLADHPLEAGVHPRFTVDAAGVARAAAAREAVEGWLFDAARDDDADLFALVESGIAAPELEAMVEALLAAAMPPERFAEDPLAPARLGALAARLSAAARAFLDAEAGALRCARRRTNGGRVAEAVEATATLAAQPPEDATRLAALVGALAEQWPEALCKRLGEFAAGKVAADAERSALGDRLPSVCAAAAGLDPLLRHVLALDPERLARVHRVVGRLHGRAAERLRRDGAESFDALLRRASALVVRHPEVTERLRARIDQLLVDEFQDTDAAQCELVARLALEGGGPRPGLFAVGDPKQSIYGWRNADLAAYDDFRERLRGAGGEVHLLCVNHRSTRSVLDEVERALAPVMREVPREQPRFEPLLPARDEAGHAVEYWIASDWPAEARAPAPRDLRAATRREAAWLAADLLRLAREAREAGRPPAWEQVGILLRATSDVDVYLSALRAAGIPYTVTRDRQYARRREVVEARALVRAVLDPGDQIALVATLRSAWAGVPDAAWRPLWRYGFPEAARRLLDGRQDARQQLRDVLWAAAQDVAREQAAVPGFADLAGWSEALLHAVEVLAALRRSFLREPSERFVERLRTLPLLAAGEACRFLGPWRLANLERFLRDLGRLLEEGRGDEAPVLRALRREEALDADWDEGRPARPGDDAVQVMTIHGAKGLQFEHVYLLQVHKGEARDLPEPFRCGEGPLAGEWCLGLARVATPGFDQVRAARRRIEENERVRTLYVAMTRACRRLVVSGEWSRGIHGRLLAEGRGAALQQAIAEGAAAGAGWDGTVACDGARWVFLDRARPPDGPALAGRAGAPPLDEGRVRDDAEQLAAAAAGANRRAARPFVAAVTAAAAARAGEDEAEEGEDRPRRHPLPGADRTAAAAVGTAIHALLERFDWERADSEAEWERQRVRVQAALERSVAPGALPAARARAEALLARLRGGRLWARLRELAPHVVARELPVLIEAGDDAGPAGAGVGAVDLVARDPAEGWLVVDFKSDRVEGEAALAERSEHHRPQGLAYQRAVARALGLASPPRVELWFLEADRAVALE